MITVTARDKIFASVVVPLALLGWFIYSVHCPLYGRLSALSNRLDSLGNADELALERKALEGELERAREELRAAQEEDALIRAAEAKAAAEKGVKVRGGIGGFVEILGSVDSVRVISVSKQEAVDLNLGDSLNRGLALLRSANQGVELSQWSIELEADYLSLVKVLKLLSEYDFLYIAGSLSMEPLRDSDFLRRWQLNLFL